MINLFESRFLRLDYVPEQALLLFRWLPSSEEMNREDYKREMLRYIEQVEQHHPRKLLANLQDFLFPIDLELQEWSNEVVLVRGYAAGLREVAFVMSSDFISNLSVEQTMDESEGQKFQTMYFDNEEEARQWLIGQSMEGALLA